MDIEWDVSKLTASQKKIADFIEKSGEHILYYSETELAKALQVSNATISRFWKSIGYDNFKSFKATIKEQEKVYTRKQIKKLIVTNSTS